MKIMTSRIAVASALAALSLSAVAADERGRGRQVDERHDGAAAQVRGVGEVLSSWTGSIPVGPREGTVAVVASSDHEARVDHAAEANHVLTSWAGSIPVESSARMNTDRGGADESGGHFTAATEVLDSWNGWISSHLAR